ncbi:MAG: sterol desaturase family protein [Flavobacteriaceae bacterium]|nr:sterol desaturase family protein [Flavobacteriaceae bacterium]
MEYLELFIESFLGTLNWIFRQIFFRVANTENYFWGLIIISLVVWILELAFPWRKNQKMFRQDFWLDLFYMFFNFFLFSIFIDGFYKIINKATYNLFLLNADSITLFKLSNFSPIIQLVIFFVILDFFQWITHILLHKYDFLWKFHKVHHSVKEMGFAAHLRYHWMENILYKPLKVLAIMLIGGFEPEQAFIIHFLAITIGHLNHANINLSYGPLKYIFNNPVMHLYHHAYSLPNKFKTGVNFAISLSVWDYMFKTNYIPKAEGNIKLGYEGDSSMSKDFIGQLFYGFKKGD